MSSKTKKAPKTDSPESKPDDKVRSIRFRAEQYDAIAKRAKELDIEFATFVRQSALDAAGVGRTEIKRIEKLAASLAKVSA